MKRSTVTWCLGIGISLFASLIVQTGQDHRDSADAPLQPRAEWAQALTESPGEAETGYLLAQLTEETECGPYGVLVCREVCWICGPRGYTCCGISCYCRSTIPA